MYNKEFWDKIKINDVAPKTTLTNPISVKVTTVTEEELTRVSVLKAFLNRKLKKNNINCWEQNTLEEINAFVNKIWGTK